MELNYKEIGKRIAARRRQLGLKQSEVAELLRPMNSQQLALAKSFLTWLSNENIKNKK